jgi:hypothetical protein
MLRRLFVVTFVSFALLVCQPLIAQAQLEVTGDLVSNCSKIEGLRKKGDKTGARDAARQCLAGLEQELESEVGKYFLPDVAGWKRSSFEQNNVLGMRNASAEYQKGGKTVRVSLMGGSGGGAGGGLGGALGNLARMGMMGSGRQVRIANLPATISPEGQVMVPLTDGSFLSFESSEFRTPDAALAGMGDLLNAFPVKDINQLLSEG